MAQKMKIRRRSGTRRSEAAARSGRMHDRNIRRIKPGAPSTDRDIKDPRNRRLPAGTILVYKKAA
tara:strand:+ start:3273 stop:3467 length:195 start_codon:yes stop_codon:yes gene_type:complete